VVVIISILALTSGLDGCLRAPEPSPYSRLGSDLGVVVERTFATDHIWRERGPRDVTASEDAFVLLYLRLTNKGGQDLPADDLLFILEARDDWSVWSSATIPMGYISLDEDPRFTGDMLDTRFLPILPKGSLAGWTIFNLKNSTLLEGRLTLTVFYGTEEDPVHTVEVPLDGLETDWSYPPMVSAVPLDLQFTNLHGDDRVYYGERLFVANLTLLDAWPVPACIDLEGVNMTDANGTVHAPISVVSNVTADDDILNFDHAANLELVFRTDRGVVPSSILLVDDPPSILRIDPATIVDAPVPCRVAVSANYMYRLLDVSGTDYLVVNVTMNGTSDDAVPVRSDQFSLLDCNGTFRDACEYDVGPARGLLRTDLPPGASITGELIFGLPNGTDPRAVVHDDGGRFQELALASVPMRTVDTRPRLGLRVEHMNITRGGTGLPFVDYFSIRLEIQNLMPFEAPFSVRSFTLYDADGRSYKRGVNPPSDSDDLAWRNGIRPRETLSGHMSFTVELNATPVLLEYDDSGYMHRVVLDPREITVLESHPRLVFTVEETLCTHRIDDDIAENGSRILVLRLKVENTGADVYYLHAHGLRLWDSDRSNAPTVRLYLIDQGSEFSYQEIPPGGSVDVYCAFKLEASSSPMYLSYVDDACYHIPLYGLEFPTVELYPRLNITVVSMAYMDEVEGLTAPPGSRFLVMNMTVTNRWLEPIYVDPTRFMLENQTGVRVLFLPAAEDLPLCLMSDYLARGELASGRLYFLVKIGYEPTAMSITVPGGEIQVPVDPGPA